MFVFFVYGLEEKKSNSELPSAVNVMLWEVGQTRDRQTSVMVKMGETRDGTVRDRYVTNLC